MSYKVLLQLPYIETFQIWMWHSTGKLFGLIRNNCKNDWTDGIKLLTTTPVSAKPLQTNVKKSVLAGILWDCVGW